MISDCSSSAPDYGGDESSAGEYVTADDGYEADNEVPSKSSRDEDNSQQNNLPKGLNSLGSTIEYRGGHITANTTAHPALCSLAVDLLIQFGQQ